MTRTMKHIIAGLLVSPALALAQAPVVPAVPKPMTPPVATLPAAPAPAVPAPAIALPEPPKAEEAQADEPAAPKEKFLLEKLLAGSPAAQTLGKNGWTIYGWTQGSYNVSSASNSNLPVPFIDRANQFSLNQNWLHVEKAIDTSKQQYQWGLGTDLILPGTDARFSIARGLGDAQVRRGDLYPIDLFQAYVDLFSPNVGPQGTIFRFGKFATHCEYEVVQGISNPFVSRSYLFQYNPFTHTGVNAITQLDDDWTVSNGAVLGNDNFIDPAAQLTYIGQVKWAPKNGKTSALFNVSAMSFGSMSRNAILALSSGARLAGCYHNTGEGGISPYHLEGGADLSCQLGTAKFGARNRDGSFNPEMFKEKAAHENVKMIEIKLSQGAKPGHGG
ncbi:MAG: outer membrane beta-barrel protein, partial [Gemmataceae bacterium]